MEARELLAHLLKSKKFKLLLAAFSIVVISSIIFASSSDKESLELPELEETTTVKEKKAKDSMYYGFNLNLFEVVRDTVKSGDSFGELLLKHRVGYPEIHSLTTKKNRAIFDLRKIRVGRPYTILKSKDSINKAELFIYEIDKVNYAIVDLRDKVSLERKEREIKSVEREASGVITTSLSEAILDQGIDYDVTHNLAAIYAWTIDFWRLSKGDKFKVIYDEHYINDNTYVGMGPIKAAYFEHNGKAFLRAPVNFSRISSRYNLKRRISYYGNKVKPHKGTDYAAKVGTPIMATANGRVIAASYTRANGNYVKIRHNNTYSTQYLHMSKRKVKNGDYVKQGDVIGWVGMTGNTSGPHVCYRFWKNGRQVDPLKEKLPKAKPLPEPSRLTYINTINPVKSQLDCIGFFNESFAQSE
jgi:murein DD-endopeptidase